MMRLCLTFFICLLTSFAHAELLIEITRGADDATPIAIVPFAGSIPANNDALTDIIEGDLNRSGKLRSLPDEKLPVRPSSAGEVLYNEWRNIGANYLLVGSSRLQADNRYEITFELLSLDRQTRILGEKMTVPAEKWRDAAHFISDKVFEKIIGIKGAFSTRILYVNQYYSLGKRRYRLELSDADGHRPISILDSPEPILSPGWSPDGKQVTYVSFENHRPAIFIQNIATEQRRLLASYPGLNGAPSWSPDGKELLLTLSRDGNPEIYLMNIASGDLTRLTNHPAIDTEPRWMPDGKNLIFTSDRGGSAQIYKMDIASRTVKRLTFEGSFNARSDISPDGRYLAMVHRQKGQQFQIAIQDLQTNTLTIITQTPLDESPSFAPNGAALVYATRKGKYGELGISTLDGRLQVRLPARLGEVREPSWSPFLR